jgi:tRNA1(Val) A37 N6-methylase TrmN6
MTVDVSEPSAITQDLVLGGKLTLRQPKRGHRIGTDTVLLLGFAAQLPGERVLDLGAGVGTLGIALAILDAGRSAVLVEREAELAELAAANAVLNGVADRVVVLSSEVGSLRPERLIEGEAVDLVVCNPPFHDPRRHRASPDPLRKAAHMSEAGLGAWVEIGAWALRTRGQLAMICRADALAGLLPVLTSRFGSVTVQPVHAKAAEPASRILVGAVKGGRAPLRLLPGLVVHEPDGRFTPRMEAWHRGDVSPFLRPLEAAPD